MLEYLKNYYVCMLVFLVFSFLVPKEEYKAYIQFFISIFLIVLLLKPIMHLFTMEDTALLYELFEQVNMQIESIDAMDLEEGGNLYEHFLLEGEGK